MSKQTTTETRSVGRPASFPGQECKAFLATIPVTTRQMLRDVATKRSEPINITLDRFIQQGFKNATRTRSKRS